MGANRLFSLLVFGIISAMAFTACGEDAPELTESQRVAEAAWADAAAISEAKGFIAYARASKHLGDEGTVRGTITNYQYDSDMTGKPYASLFNKPDVAESEPPTSGLKASEAFKLVIWEDAREKFPAQFATGYTGNMVCATGMIIDIEGSPAIAINEPIQTQLR
jgi:hypothetical protein